MTDDTTYAVRLVARNCIVDWPHPVWWRFWSKVQRRMGFHVVKLITAPDQGQAEERARAALEAELTRKAHNDPSDPWQVRVEGSTLASDHHGDLDQKTWFADD